MSYSLLCGFYHELIGIENIEKKMAIIFADPS